MLGLWGAGAFGAVIGWIAYRTLRRAAEGSRIADLVTVVAALGGGAVVNNQFAEPDLFAAYGLGLFVGFFGYFVVGWRLDRSEAAKTEERPAAGVPAQPGAPDAAPAPSEGTDRAAPHSTSTWMGEP
ncbi:hypothetical protein [Streptomyces venezuelae]|uniref:hypothetical protein n=1 Tax=Streptomyces venezuelae TaxID=54571 RepID=UPI00278BF5D7|nr:hypothetical protein [Streptomyces venezuelae]